MFFEGRRVEEAAEQIGRRTRLPHRRVRAIVVSIAVLVAIALAKPAYMDRYNADPYSKAGLRGKCTVCHIGRGGGERNDFGEAFEDAGLRITPKLRAKFPKLFEKADTGEN